MDSYTQNIAINNFFIGNNGLFIFNNRTYYNDEFTFYNKFMTFKNTDIHNLEIPVMADLYSYMFIRSTYNPDKLLRDVVIPVSVPVYASKHATITPIINKIEYCSRKDCYRFNMTKDNLEYYAYKGCILNNNLDVLILATHIVDFDYDNRVFHVKGCKVYINPNVFTSPSIINKFISNKLFKKCLDGIRFYSSDLNRNINSETIELRYDFYDKSSIIIPEIIIKDVTDRFVHKVAVPYKLDNSDINKCLADIIRKTL